MPVRELDQTENQRILECLKAVVDGPFLFNDGEFHSLIGADRAEVAAIAEDWWARFDDDDLTQTVINNSLLALLHYPHKHDHVLPRYLSFEVGELDLLLARYRALRGCVNRGRNA